MSKYLMVKCNSCGTDNKVSWIKPTTNIKCGKCGGLLPTDCYTFCWFCNQKNIIKVGRSLVDKECTKCNNLLFNDLREVPSKKEEPKESFLYLFMTVIIGSTIIGLAIWFGFGWLFGIGIGFIMEHFLLVCLVGIIVFIIGLFIMRLNWGCSSGASMGNT